MTVSKEQQAAEIVVNAIKYGCRKGAQAFDKGVDLYQQLGDHTYKYTPDEAPNVKRVVGGFFALTGGTLGITRSLAKFFFNKAFK